MSLWQQQPLTTKASSGAKHQRWSRCCTEPSVAGPLIMGIESEKQIVLQELTLESIAGVWSNCFCLRVYLLRVDHFPLVAFIFQGIRLQFLTCLQYILRPHYTAFSVTHEFSLMLIISLKNCKDGGPRKSKSIKCFMTPFLQHGHFCSSGFWRVAIMQLSSIGWCLCCSCSRMTVSAVIFSLLLRIP